MKASLKTWIFAIGFLSSIIANSQISKDSELYKTLKKNDSLIFDSAFNECKSEDMVHLIMEDFEFYHDTGGVTNGKEEFLRTTKQNICGNPNVRPYRELVKGSLEVYTLKKNGVLYGAIQKGDHNFYLKENGEVRPTVTAKFTHLWILENKKWMLKRVLSYDHQPLQH